MTRRIVGSAVVISVNDAPVLGAEPMATYPGREGELLSISIAAVDEEGDSLNFSASGLPIGAQIDAVTGLFTWIPDSTQADDLLGQRIRSYPPAGVGSGPHSLVWDGRDGGGRDVSSGVYMVRLRWSDNSQIRRVTLIR